jgi:hypothetical protein
LSSSDDRPDSSLVDVTPCETGETPTNVEVGPTPAARAAPLVDGGAFAEKLEPAVAGVGAATWDTGATCETGVEAADGVVVGVVVEGDAETDPVDEDVFDGDVVVTADDDVVVPELCVVRMVVPGPLDAAPPVEVVVAVVAGLTARKGTLMVTV